MGKEYKKTARLITSYLKSRFISSGADITEQELRVWADQLETAVDVGQLTQENIKRACDLYADINGNGFPPTVDQFTRCLNKVSFVQPKVFKDKSEDIDYLVLWEKADDRQKYRFFIDHVFIKVPPYIRLYFRDYMKEHHGWSHTESNKMINYHASPFNGADMGAYITNQREIIAYFNNKKQGKA